MHICRKQYLTMSFQTEGNCYAVPRCNVLSRHIHKSRILIKISCTYIYNNSLTPTCLVSYQTKRHYSDTLFLCLHPTCSHWHSDTLLYCCTLTALHCTRWHFSQVHSVQDIQQLYRAEVYRVERSRSQRSMHICNLQLQWKGPSNKGHNTNNLHIKDTLMHQLPIVVIFLLPQKRGQPLYDGKMDLSLV